MESGGGEGVVSRRRLELKVADGHGNLLVPPPPVPTGTNCTNSGTEGVKRKYPPIKHRYHPFLEN